MTHVWPVQLVFITYWINGGKRIRLIREKISENNWNILFECLTWSGRAFNLYVEIKTQKEACQFTGTFFLNSTIFLWSFAEYIQYHHKYSINIDFGFLVTGILLNEIRNYYAVWDFIFLLLTACEGVELYAWFNGKLKFIRKIEF